MTTSRRRSRFVTVLVGLALCVGLPAAWQGATGESTGTPEGPFRQGIVVVGDSITALYNDEPGHPEQGWWSMVGRRLDTHVRTFAQSGSGYQRPGHACSGNRFADRTEAFEGPPPSVFIVEGGRNDWASCREGALVPSADDVVRSAVDRYFSTLRRELPRSTRIVVLGPPWGSLDAWRGRRVTAIVRDEAVRHELEYVSTAGTLDGRGRTVDGVHPSRAGSEALADAVVAALSAAPEPG